MAADLIRRGRVCLGAWVLLWCAGAACQEQELTDPTALPPGLAARKGEPEAGLQSIVISGGRRAAIINGQTVELGGKVGDVRLIEITESGVVLQGTRGRQVMTLFPDVKISRKPLPVEEETKDLARKDGMAGKPAGQAGKREEK